MPGFMKATFAVLAASVMVLASGCGGGGGTRPWQDTTPPAAVDNLSVSSKSDSSVTLAWTAPGDDDREGTVTKYDLRHSFAVITEENWVSATAVVGEPEPGIVGTQESFTVPGLLADTTYYFALKSADDVTNWSGLSNVVSARTNSKLDTSPPDRVTDLSVGSVTDVSITLTWTAPGDDGGSGTAAQYDLRYRLSEITDENWSSCAQVQAEPVPSTPGSEESFTVSGLEPNTTYYFALTASDEVPNVSALSNVVSAATAEAPDTVAPEAIADLTIGQTTSSAITLTWTASGDDGSVGTAAGYDLRYSTSTITEGTWASAQPATGEPLPSGAGTGETFTVSGLAPGAHYCFALKVVDDAANESGLSNVACGDTKAPPTAVGSVDPTAGTLATVFHFDASASSDLEDPLTSLEFQWDWNGDGVADFQTTGVPTADYQFAMVGDRTVILRVVDTDGLSDLDTVQVVVTEIPDETPPAAVDDLVVLTVASTSITLRWTAPGNDGDEGTANAYDVRYAAVDAAGFVWSSGTEAQGEPAPASAGSVQSFTVSGLDPKTTYSFALETRDAAGNVSSISNIVSGVTNTPPTAAFAATPPSGTTAAAIEFDASASADAEDSGGDLEFSWDWNHDGVFDDQQTGNPVIQHLFPSAGTYTVVLRVVDTLGLSDQDTLQVVVTDGIAPAAVTDLAAGAVTHSSVNLTWTAPGDDGTTGTAASYDLRYSTQEITEGTWASAVAAVGVPAPQYAGASESFTVTGLVEETLYYFALKTRDEVSNLSGLSNVVAVTTESQLQPPEVVLVPHSAYTMGDGIAYCGEGEHAVTLTRDFHLGQYEVTNQEYVDWLQWAYDHGYVTATTASVSDHLDGSTAELLDLDDPDCEIQFSGGTFSLRNAGHGLNPDHPAKEVTWYGAAAFCDWLSLRAGLTRAYDHATWECNGGNPYGAAGYRLPTDAEWEFAAQYDDERAYPWGDTSPSCSIANYGGCLGWTAPVGSYPGAPVINGSPLYDMAGNVWEWCNDWHVCNLGSDPVVDPTGPATGQRKVLRGGAWDFFTYYPRCAYRSDSYPYLGYTYIGFRVARTVES